MTTLIKLSEMIGLRPPTRTVFGEMAGNAGLCQKPRSKSDGGGAMQQAKLPVFVYEALKKHRARCAAKARSIQLIHGSSATYRQTLTMEIITEPDGPQLEEFHQLYRSIFTLEDESEPIEGFATVLGFNRSADVQRDFGPFYEPILVLRDPSDGQLVGAANFAIYAYPGRQDTFGKFDASCQLNFLLVRAELRGLGIATDLLHHTEAEVTQFARQHCGSARTFTTIEMNDPARMTAEQIEADALAALIDPADRLAWWHKQGFHRLELPYVQPALNADLNPCTYLDYFIRCATPPDGSQLDAIPSAVLHEHLRRFFTISVGKLTTDMERNPEWRGVDHFLSSKADIRIETVRGF